MTKKIAFLGGSSIHWEYVAADFDVMKYIMDREWVHDCDQCGNTTRFYAVGEAGEFKFYRAKHSWWWHNDYQADRELINEFDIMECTRDDLDKYAKANLKFVV